MSSETEFPDPTALIERLISSMNNDLSIFLPFILALASSPTSPSPVQDPSNPDQESSENLPTPIGSSERIVLINPLTQGMVVIEGSNISNPSTLDSLLRDLFGKEGQPPASKVSIESMPAVEVGEEGQECVICLEEWEAGGLAKEMPCKHRFHGECIEKWLKVHGTCPVCRFQMPVEENDEKGSKNGGNGGRRRHIWLSFAYRDDDTSNRSDEEGNHSGSTNNSGDSSVSSATDN